ncbi:MAG: hypothetical protein ACLFP9_01915 [Desulfonatronovibrio sp.]
MRRALIFITCISTMIVFSMGTIIQAQDQEDGERIMTLRCMKCHDLERIKEADKDHEDWTETVDRMMGIGASVTPDEKEILIEYLSR